RPAFAAGTVVWNPSSRYHSLAPDPGRGWPVPLNASQRLYISLFQSPSPIVVEPMWWNHGRSVGSVGYGWKPTVSRIGAARPLPRYAVPTSRMNAPGEVDVVLSFPVDESARPITFTLAKRACRTS